MFEGLYLYEVLLMICGVALFMALLGILVHHVRNAQKYGGLKVFFALPVLMIGFPGIAKFQFEEGKFSIEKYARELEENPGNDEACKALEEAVEQVEQRTDSTRSNADTLTLLAEGNLTLGRLDKALNHVDRAKAIKPDSAEAGKLEERIGVRKIDSLVPRDAVGSAVPVNQVELSNVVVRLGRNQALSTEGRLAISRAALAIGQTNQARSNLLEL